MFCPLLTACIFQFSRIDYFHVSVMTVISSIMPSVCTPLAKECTYSCACFHVIHVLGLPYLESSLLPSQSASGLYPHQQLNASTMVITLSLSGPVRMFGSSLMKFTRCFEKPGSSVPLMKRAYQYSGMLFPIF